MGIDMFDEGYQRAVVCGVDWMMFNEYGLEMFIVLIKLLIFEEFKVFMQSGVFDFCMIRVVVKVGEVMVDSNWELVKLVGIWVMFIGMVDKDCQWVLGFLLFFFKYFGKWF